MRTLITVWLALLALLALSVASAWTDLGVGNLLANIGIAATKAVLVAWFFMHLRRDAGVMRLTALLGLIWLLFLIGLSLADTLTRPAMETPGLPEYRTEVCESPGTGTGIGGHGIVGENARGSERCPFARGAGSGGVESRRPPLARMRYDWRLA